MPGFEYARRILMDAGGAVLPFERPKGKTVFRVRAAGDTAEIDFFGVVGGDFWGDGGVTQEQFAAETRKLSNAKRVKMRLSSPGGDVHHGRAIANIIRQHPAAFDVNIIAEASSAASVIAMAGDSVHMAEGSVMLVHRCYTLMVGNSVEMRKLAGDLETIDNEIIATYARKTKMKPADIAALMDENRYMNADEAKRLGFADTIDAAPKQASGYRIAAMDIDRSKFRLPPLPEALRPRRTAALAALDRMKVARA